MTIEESYKVLKLKPGATENEIRSAYKTQIKKYHPDTFKGDKNVATEKTMQINQAYRILTFKEKPTGPSRSERQKKKNKFSLFAFFKKLIKKFKRKQKAKKEKTTKENKVKQQKTKKQKTEKTEDNTKENNIEKNLPVSPELIIIGIMAIILLFLAIWFFAAGKK